MKGGNDTVSRADLEAVNAICTALQEQVEDLFDLLELERRERTGHGGDPIPATVAVELLDGANPIRVWRKHRSLTGVKLAAAAGITSAYLSDLETGKRVGTPDTLRRIAGVLGRSIDDLMPLKLAD